MKYRIAAVSYINTLPFLKGLQSPELKGIIDVVLAHPARCAELLQNGEVDIALCPIGALTSMDRYHVITDYCIGCDGPVRTVSIYSDKPLSELTHVELFAESRTSNLLAQILNQEYWHYNIEFLPGLPTKSGSHGAVPEHVDRVPPKLASAVAQGPAFRQAQRPSSGFLFIGDICFQKEKEFAYRTDLGQSWKEWTGLPFAFACWVSRDKIEDHIVQLLNSAFANGIENIDDLTFPAGIDDKVLREYLRKNISYEFDTAKKKAMDNFLDLVKSDTLERKILTTEK